MPTPIDIVNFLSEYEQKRKEEETKKLRAEQEERKKAARAKKVQDVIDSIRKEIGGNFSDYSFAINQYEERIKAEFEKCISIYFEPKTAIQKVMELHNQELGKWLDEPWITLKDEVEVPYKEEAIEYLRKKFITLYNVYDSIFITLLSRIYIEKAKGKQWLIKMLDTITFPECLQLLKQFQNKFHELNRFSQKTQRYVDDSVKEVIREYMIFYDYAYILVSKRTNELSYNKEKNTYIDEDKYNVALMYFYEGKTLEEIKEIIKRNTYIQNKNKGSRGEEVVDYALSWLPKQFVNIPQVSVGRYDQKCILLQNLDFRNERQEFDHIIVGPQGIFLIETKNFAGEITIDEEGNWIRRKDCQGVVGERNPIEQIRRHEKLMQSIAPDVNIVSIMCLSHPKVVVNGAGNSPVKILKSDLLCEYIENYKVDSLLSGDEIQAVVDKIKSYIV